MKRRPWLCPPCSFCRRRWGRLELSRETIAAWTAYVARNGDRPSRSGAAPRGDMIDVPGGTIYHSTGSILIRNTTVDRVVHALMYPGTPPPQEDVLESRVLARSGDRLRVYLKLARSAIVTVVYEPTEHYVTFTRHSPPGDGRSVSTRIAESDGGDRGFCGGWNSYWRTRSSATTSGSISNRSRSAGPCRASPVPWLDPSSTASLANRCCERSNQCGGSSRRSAHQPGQL